MPAETTLQTLLYGVSNSPDDWPWLMAAPNPTLQQKAGTGLFSLRNYLRQESVVKAESAVAASFDNVLLILPAEAALITGVAVPSAKLQHIQAAVPNLVEEWSASELEEMHIAIGARSSAGIVPVVVIDRHYLRQSIDRLTAAGLRAERVLIDAMLLPHSSDTLTIVLDNRRALLRWSEHQAGAIEIDSLTTLLEKLLQHENIRSLQIFAFSNADSSCASVLQDISRLQKSSALTIEHRQLEASPEEFFASRLVDSEQLPLNLRQGKFAALDNHHLQWRRWRPAAAVVAICFALQIILNIILGATLDHRGRALHEQAANLYRELFPQDKRLVNIKQQMQSHLSTNNLSGNASFMNLFGHLAKAIQETPDKQPPQLRTLQFDADSGALQVEIVVANVQALDDLKKHLSADSVATKVLSAVNQDGSLVGRLSLTGNQ